MSIVTRFAPSPTGLLHAGNYRTAVFAYLFARHSGGTFILRIEDTDKARSKKEYEDNILESLKWLGLSYDSFFRQSELAKRHEEILSQLIAEGKAYVSKETPKEEGERAEVIRFRNPNKPVTLMDVIRGPITMDTTDLGDFVIAKSLTEPIFHLVNVVDDIDEGVTHIVRGEDHVSNTPRQILLFEALGATPPVYIHLPLVLAPDRSKLSKRKGALPLLDYRDKGYLPEALLNYMALVGWNPGTNEELFTLDELVKRFTPDQVQKSGAIFDDVKLKWFNREHLLKLSDDAFWSLAQKFLSPDTVAGFDMKGLHTVMLPILRERIQTFEDLRIMDEAGEFTFFFREPEVLAEKLIWKDATATNTKQRLEESLTLLQNLYSWTGEDIKAALWPFAEKEGRGEVLWPLRVALSGRDKSPDPFTIAGIIGKDETLKRITRAIELLT